VKSPGKVAVAPEVIEAGVKETHPVADHCFQPGDIVSFRTNSRGTVLAVTGDGVQVDFGLGYSWFCKDMLSLVKAASNT